jgi:signal transduction histidine kinase/ActR/RegA family two-component response regulator
VNILDPRSIVVISGLLAVVILIILISLRRSASIRGIDEWIAAFVLVIATVLLLVFRSHLPFILGHVLANVTLVVAILLFDLGLQKLYGVPARLRPRLLSAAGVMVLLVVVVLATDDDFNLRLTLVTAVLMGCLGWTLWHLLRHSSGTFGERVTQIALAVPLAGVALRLYTVGEVGRESVLFQPTVVQSLYLTSLGAGLLTAGVGFILIVNERTRARLETLARDLEQTTRELRQQNEIKSKFLAYAGHDIRQPLQAIHLLLAGLMHSGLTARQQDTARMMESSANALSDLLDTLLDISKLDAGAIKPYWQSVDLDVLLVRVVQEFMPQAAARGLWLKLRLGSGRYTVRTDERLLASALRNLVGNAIKYTQRGGVLVAVRRASQGLKLQVWDTGVGIAPQHLGHVFEEYYQVDNPQRDRRRGLGLGLAIVSRISDLLDLHIRCQSRPGRGTLMEFSLPLAVEQGAASVPLPVADAAPELQGRHVVVVEDTEEVARALVLWLQSRGARVTQYASAEAALASSATFGADLYLSDYRLPGPQNGIDFLNAVRARAGEEARGVLITGDTSSAFISMAAISGWPILFKPVHPRELAAVLKLQLQVMDDQLLP